MAVAEAGELHSPAGLVAQPPGEAPQSSLSVPQLSRTNMADWMVKLQKVLQIVVFVVGSVLTLMGQDKKTQIEVSSASGAYASSADAAPELAKAGNMTTAGLASIFSTVIIPFAFQFIGQW